MSGTVSYNLFNSRLPGGTYGFTPEGGLYETFINKTTGDSVKGTIVVVSTLADNAVSTAPAGSQMPIGVIYESGIHVDSSVKVVVYGKAEVLLENGQASTRGYWCGVSSTVDGRMYQMAAPPAAQHYQEIGHSLQTRASGENVLSLVEMHFN